MRSAWWPVLLLVGLALAPAEAHIDTGPLTGRASFPAVQKRDEGRSFLIVEAAPGPEGISGWSLRGQLVLFDARFQNDPRVVFPVDGSYARIAEAGYRETRGGAEQILVLSDASLDGDNPTKLWGHLFSPDGGATWKRVPVPFLAEPYPRVYGNAGTRGGPVQRVSSQGFRLGNDAVPFYIHVGRYLDRGAVYAVDASGNARLLYRSDEPGLDWAGALAMNGTDATGRRLLLSFADRTSSRLFIVDEGQVQPVWTAPYGTRFGEGWVTPTGGVYVNIATGYWFLKDGVRIERTEGAGVIAVPSQDFASAWVTFNDLGEYALVNHSEEHGALEYFRSPRPITAIYAGRSGQLLLRSDRSASLYGDIYATERRKGFALWREGEPVPEKFDEIVEVDFDQSGFVKLDVDGFGRGEPFVFDAGFEIAQQAFPGECCSTSFAGSPPAWGLVRGSARPSWVVPAVARAPGLEGTFWKSELVLTNPSREPDDVSVRFVPAVGEPVETTVALPAGASRRFEDVLGELFDVNRGSGALFVSSTEGVVVVESFTTTDAPAGGKRGTRIPAVSVLEGRSPRHVTTFSAAFPEEGSRTNLVIVDVSGRGSEVRYFTRNALGRHLLGSLDVPPGGARQVNGLSGTAAVSSTLGTALDVEVVRGEAIVGVIGIDALSGDPTWYPPDVPAWSSRQFPAFLSITGASGAHWESDLFLGNPWPKRVTFTLAAGPAPERNETLLRLTLEPFENRRVPDAMRTLFGWTGASRLRVYSPEAASSRSPASPTATMRVVNRGVGGSSGVGVSPSAGAEVSVGDETLEITGLALGPGFRTNVALVSRMWNWQANPAEPAEQVLLDVRIDVVGSEGEPLRTLSRKMAVQSQLQLDDLLAGLEPEGGVARVRITPSFGTFSAHATRVDSRTGDAVFIPARIVRD